MKEEYISIIGGTNIDIIGTPYSSLNLNDSNPGQTVITLGGVGRNIAENLGRLGVNVEFITVLGDDVHSKEIISNCNELSISLEHSLFMEDQRTSTYLCINNEFGEMELALSDMELTKNIVPDYLKQKLNLINGGKACIVDTNIPEDSLQYLISNCKVPIFVDTVSTHKTNKIKDIIQNIHTLKPNIIEAEILSGIKIRDANSLEKAADAILTKGIKRLFITLGSDGVYYTDGTLRGHLPTIPVDIVSTTGAGDSFIAALAWAYINNLDIKESAKAGLATSSICIKSSITVSNNISAENIKHIMKNNWR